MSNAVAGGGGGAGKMGTVTAVEMGAMALFTPLTVSWKEVFVSLAATEITALKPSAAATMVTLVSSAAHAGTLPGCNDPGTPGADCGVAVKCPDPPTWIPVIGGMWCLLWWCFCLIRKNLAGCLWPLARGISGCLGFFTGAMVPLDSACGV
jgi:hypothetical protein